MTARCAVCGRKVRVTKLGVLARHRDEYGHVCDNTGVAKVSAPQAPTGEAGVGSAANSRPRHVVRMGRVE